MDDQHKLQNEVVQPSLGRPLQICEHYKSRLYPYQVEGVQFLHSACREGRKGVILADEMGLGKSIQVISFLACISKKQNIPSILLVVPLHLLDDWVTKINDWAPWMTCMKYHPSEQHQDKNLQKVKRKGGILITTYRMIISRKKDLSSFRSNSYIWDFVICDEAHRLKNEKTQAYKVASSLQAHFRILLTGTPIQNNLKELWNLLSLISETCLVGTYQTFRKNFENPITRGREADAGADERALAQELMECLKEKIKVVWLRRTKDQLPKLPNKHEFVLWTKLSPEQEAIYRHQTSVNEAQDVTSDLLLLHKLRMICCHSKTFDGSALNSVESEAAHSGKLAILIPLLKALYSKGHRILVFFQYVQTLKVVLHSLMQTDWGQRTVLFMDGSVVLTERRELLKSFQHGSQNILLLTVKVGAEGLTLTTADRVIIMEPSWNQSTDAQAVDRVHRIGQTRVVKVYRLITCGTIEEKIYRRQLFKGSLVRQVLGDDQNPLRHFTRSDLMELNSLGETQYSTTQLQLERQNSKRLSAEEILGRQLGEQVSGSLCGISDHGQLLKASQGEDLEAEMEKLHIADEVQKSKEEIEGEAHLKCSVAPVDVPRHHKIPRKSLGLHLKGKKNASIWNDYQNKQKASLSRESVPKPVYSKWDSKKTPGFPQKYKRFSSPLTRSVWRKRHIIRSPQYGSDQSSFPFSKKESSCVKDGAAHIPDNSDVAVVIVASSDSCTDDESNDSALGTNLLLEVNSQHPSPDPIVAQTLRSPPSPETNCDFFANMQSLIQVESPTQTHRPSTTYLPTHGFMTVSSANCSDPKDQDPRTDSSETDCSTSYNNTDNLQYIAPVGPFRYNRNFGTANNSSESSLSDSSHSHNFILDSVDEGSDVNLDEAANLNSLTNDRSDGSVLLSPKKETSPFNRVTGEVTDVGNMSLNASGFHFLSLDAVSVLSVDESQHSRVELSVTQAPISSSTPLRNNGFFADVQSPRQMKGQTHKPFSPYLPPTPLLCDYSITPGTMPVPSTPQMEKTQQVSDESKSEMSSSLSYSTSVNLDDKVPERIRDDTALKISETDNNNAEFSQHSPHNLTLDSVYEVSVVDTSDLLKRYSVDSNDGNDTSSSLSCNTSVNDVFAELQLPRQHDPIQTLKSPSPVTLLCDYSLTSGSLSSPSTPHTMSSSLSYSASVNLDDMVPERIRDDTALKISETDNNNAEFSQHSPHSLTLDSVYEASVVDTSDLLRRYTDNNNDESEMSSSLSYSTSVNLDDMVPEGMRGDTALQISGKDNNAEFSPHSLTLDSVYQVSEVDTSDLLRRYTDNNNDESEMSSSLSYSTSVNLDDMVPERMRGDTALQISGKDNNAEFSPHSLTLDSVDEGSEVDTSDLLKRYSVDSNDGNDTSSSLSCNTSVNDVFAELQLPKQHDPIQTLKSPSPVTLLCDYSLTPGSLSLPSTPHTGKEPKVSDACLASNHKDEFVLTPRRECFQLLRQLKDL